MPQRLNLVAQNAMDKFYQTYKSDNAFFTIEDFIDYTGQSVGEFYLKLYQDKYKEILSEKKDEVVTFDTAFLSEMEIDVSRETFVKNYSSVDIGESIMSFPYDQNNIGLQLVLYQSNEGGDFDKKCIRTTVLQKFGLNRAPVIDRIFFFVKSANKIGIINKRMMPIKKLKIYYIPSINDDMLIPDGIIRQVIDLTIQSIKESKKDVIVRRDLGNNPNVVPQGEIDLSELKK